jgi:hypothetical protein
MKCVMKLFFFILNIVFISVVCYGNDTIPATNRFIEYTGRIDFSRPEAPCFSYSGVSIRACFTGKDLFIILDEELGQNYYHIILDGKIVSKIRPDKGIKTYHIVSGLKDTIHEIEIFRLTEQMFGKTKFYGFIVNPGSSIIKIANERTRLIEFIGNSITCGYGIEGSLGGTFGPETENHYLTYAAITSRNFNARHFAVCKSGIGIYRNYDGPEEGNKDCMPNFYSRIFLYDEFPIYDFKRKPDLVCIDLGTNDFNTPGGDSVRFVSGYLAFIDTLQARYDKPDIICLLGSMLNGNSLIEVRKYLHVIVDSANRSKKGNVYFFEMSEQSDLGLGIDYHPTIAQNLKNGTELTEYISALKGWKISDQH